MNKLVPLFVLASLALFPAAASAAKVKTDVALIRASDGVHIQVKVSSKKRFTKATRPRAVKVTAGGASYKLKRTASTRKSTTWQSAAVPGLEALGGQKVKVRISTRGKTRTVKPTIEALPPTLPVTPTPTPAPQVQLTRDDAAGQAAMSGAGDLLLEWAEFGNVSAEYRRIWMLADGTFRMNVVDWMNETGEKCREAITGTWAFKEGYTTSYNGGGVVVKVTLTLSDGRVGDDVLAFSNTDPSSVWVGAQLVKYSRNPQIMQNC